MLEGQAAGNARLQVERCIVRIGEAAAASGTTTKTIRFYEDQDLLPTPRRAPNGYRDYGDETVARLDFIRRGRSAGLKLAQISDILRVRDAGDAPCTHVVDVLDRQIASLDQQIDELTALRASVTEYRDTVAAADPVDCDAGRICSFL